MTTLKPLVYRMAPADGTFKTMERCTFEFLCKHLKLSDSSKLAFLQLPVGESLQKDNTVITRIE